MHHLGMRVAAILSLSMLTRAAHANVRTITVDQDGGGDFKTVQAAIDAVPADNAVPVVIHIKPGIYKEPILIAKGKRFITLRGDDARATLLTFDRSANTSHPDGGTEAKPDGSVVPRTVGTSGSASTFIAADDFSATDVTFENSAGEVGQAVALRITGDRARFQRCRFLGWQDTLYLHEGRAHLVDCYIEGRVDFIFGKAVAVFERCHMHSKNKDGNGGFVTAPATPPEEPWGFVFLDCKLTGDAPAYLGRPWRDYGATAFVRCDLGSHVRPEGWDNWRNPARERTARFAEFGCTGAGADRSRRVAWSRELDAATVVKLTAKTILAGADGWDPSR
jgi:pectinesterase